MHKMAFLFREIEAVNKKGEYIYKTFDSFFDRSEYEVRFGLREKTEKELRIENQRKMMAKLAEKVNQGKEE